MPRNKYKLTGTSVTNGKRKASKPEMQEVKVNYNQPKGTSSNIKANPDPKTQKAKISYNNSKTASNGSKPKVKKVTVKVNKNKKKKS